MDWISNLEKVFNDMDCPRSVTCNKLSKIEEHSYIVATTIRFETWEEQDAIVRSDRNEGRTKLPLLPSDYRQQLHLLLLVMK